MSEYVSQDALIKAARGGWSTYADFLGVVMDEKIAYRSYGSWNYLVHDTDSPNGTAAELESLWVYFDTTAHEATNSYDRVQNTTVQGTYYCKSSRNDYGGFRMETSIDGAQRSWKNLSLLQATNGSSELYDFYPPSVLNFPVFTDFEEGAAFAQAMYNYLENPTDITLNIMKAALSKSENPGKEKSPQFGPYSEPGGGYIPGGGGKPSGGTPKVPTFDNTSDKIEISTKPTLSAITSKFLHAYVVTEQSLEYIGDALFPQPVFQQPDLITAMGELGQIIFFNKQVDYMLDLLILPIDVPHGDWEPLNVGGRQLSTVIEGTTVFINGQPATNCYVDVSCGSISIDEYWVNFLDFAGTKVKLFLPYVGYVDIQPEYIIGGRLYVDYRFNILDGSFMAYVRSDSGYSDLEESLICQYAGVAAVHIPLQSKDYSAKISGLISAIGTVGAGAVSGGIGAAAAAGATANAANTIVQKPGTAHANGYNASSSYLSHRKPYLIIERQWSQFSEKYPEEIGLPSNTMCRLGDLQGLVKSANAHLDVIPASVDGKEKISQLLAEGIIL